MPVREPMANMESALRDPLVTDLMDVPVDPVHLEESAASVSSMLPVFKYLPTFFNSNVYNIKIPSSNVEAPSHSTTHTGNHQQQSALLPPVR